MSKVLKLRFSSANNRWIDAWSPRSHKGMSASGHVFLTILDVTECADLAWAVFQRKRGLKANITEGRRNVLISDCSGVLLWNYHLIHNILSELLISVLLNREEGNVIINMIVLFNNLYAILCS